MKNIAIIMGGYSSEVQISILSGNVVYNNLDKSRYNTYRIHILKEGWYYCDENDLLSAVDKNDFSIIMSSRN